MDTFIGRLRIGEGFEDFVCEKIEGLLGRKVTPFRTKEDQKFAENDAFTEIKFDQQWQRTGNLFIQTKKTIKGDLVPGGVFAEDQNLKFVIGDKTKFWVFDREHRRSFIKGRRELTGGKNRDTRGCLITTVEADREAMGSWPWKFSSVEGYVKR